MSAFPELGIVILAAGASSRMKQIKALLYYKGQTLIERVYHQASSMQPAKIWVISGAHTDKLQHELSLNQVNIPLIHNALWQEGMSTSIKKGVQLAKKEKNIQGLLILLVDQPLLDGAFLSHLANTFFENPNLPVATKYNGVLGTPAIFPRSWFTKLLKLQGDKGARGLLNAEQPILPHLDNPMAAYDVDTPEDFARIIR